MSLWRKWALLLFLFFIGPTRTYFRLYDLPLSVTENWTIAHMTRRIFILNELFQLAKLNTIIIKLFFKIVDSLFDLIKTCPFFLTTWFCKHLVDFVNAEFIAKLANQLCHLLFFSTFVFGFLRNLLFKKVFKKLYFQLLVHLPFYWQSYRDF